MSLTFTYNRVSCIQLQCCVKILFNYRGQTQQCNRRLDLFESQLCASTSTSSNRLQPVFATTACYFARAFEEGGDNAYWTSKPSQRHHRRIIRATCLVLCYCPANHALLCRWTSTENIEFDSSLARMHTNPDELCAEIQL